MKKIISLFLCAALVLGLAVSAFALSIAPSADKTVIKAGEDVTVTLRFDEALSAVNTIAVRIYFDSALFEKKGYEPLDANISGLTTTPKTDEVGTYITLNYVCLAASGAAVAAGDFCRITFTAKSDLTAEQTASFGSRVVTLGYANATFGSPTEPVTVSVTVQPAGSCVAVNAAALPAGNAWTMKAGEFQTVDLAKVFTDTAGHALSYGFSVTDSKGKTYENPQIHVSSNAATASVLTFSTPDPDTYTLTLFAACAETKQRAEAQITVTVEAVADGLPIQYGYNETPADSVTVFATISSDGIPLCGNDDDSTVLSHLKITVPYFDLGLYELQDYYRYATENGRGGYTGEEVIHRPTAMHLFIYMLERYYLGLPENQCGKGESNLIGHAGEQGVTNMFSNKAYDDTQLALEYTGGATSTYMKQVWGHDENLMYYRNHVYPLQSAGWGSTSDYILLSDGDTIDMAMFTDWNFYTHGSFTTFVDRDVASQDGGSNLDHLDVNARPETAFAATVGTEKTFSAVKFGTQSVAEGGTDGFMSLAGDKYAEGYQIALYDENWNEVTENETIVSDWTADENGRVTVTFAKPGTYYLLGLDPAAGTNEACIAPATAKIVVTEKTEPEYILGDVNGDGKLNAQDVQMLRNFLLKKITLTKAQRAAADVNHDNSVNAQDVQKLRNFLLKKISSLD